MEILISDYYIIKCKHYNRVQKLKMPELRGWDGGGGLAPSHGKREGWQGHGAQLVPSPGHSLLLVALGNVLRFPLLTPRSWKINRSTLKI